MQGRLIARAADDAPLCFSRDQWYCVDGLKGRQGNGLHHELTLEGNKRFFSPAAAEREGGGEQKLSRTECRLCRESYREGSLMVWTDRLAAYAHPECVRKYNAEVNPGQGAGLAVPAARRALLFDGVAKGGGDVPPAPLPPLSGRELGLVRTAADELKEWVGNSAGRHGIVAARAGTGKTHVVVVLKESLPGHSVYLTFNRDAAAQLVHRGIKQGAK